jgi:hypothetical protein
MKRISFRTKNKKLLGGIALLAIMVLAAFNMKFAMDTRDSSIVYTKNMEAMSNEMNPWYLWLSQGFTQDEQEATRQCSNQSFSAGATISYKGVTINLNTGSNREGSEGRVEYICKFGHNNCSPVGC